MNEEPNKKRGLLGLIRYYTGFYRNPPYIEERLREADIHSAIYLTGVVSLIELWMLVRYTLKYGSMCDTVGEFFNYTSGYWILLGAALALQICARLSLAGKLKTPKWLIQVFIFAFFALGLHFGVVTSLNDFSRGRMIICFMTMLMYVTEIVIIRPFVSLVLTLVPSYVFIYLINHQCFDKTGAQVTLNSGDMINFLTFLVSLVILEVSVYFQRYREAWKSYRLEMASLTDDLTGIPNMRRFEQEARRFMDESREGADAPLFLILNIEHFQTFNDQYGYGGGDQLLVELGHILRETFQGEPVARDGMDHFVVLTGAADYLERLSSIRERVKGTYPLDTYLDVKVGGYRMRERTDNPRHAIDRAHYAMKQVQNIETEFFQEYDAALSQEYLLKQYVLNHVEGAVKNGDIKVYYQPVVWAGSGRLAGCEALVRWIDPKMGFMNPGMFISTLEEGRQIHKLDLCVYETVCRQIRECIDKGLPVLPTSLNFSRMDFELMDAIGELERLVQKYQIPKDYVHVEITESVAMKDANRLKGFMDRLHGLGYAVWLDDFGSGYSSLNLLKGLDFDLLKIDMEFLRNFHGNEKSRKIIASVISLSQALGMQTLCEGVETQEAVDFLRLAGCERLQGFYYSKPVPYEELVGMISEGKLVL